MLKINNVKESYKEFKKIFRNESMIYVKIIPYSYTQGRIEFSSIDVHSIERKFTVEYTAVCFNSKIFMSGIYYNDAIIACLFDDKGCTISGYSNDYPDVVIKNKYDTEYQFSTVIFSTQKLVTRYNALSYDNGKVIERINF